MAAITWTATEDATLTALHAKARTLGQCAVEMGCAKSTISREAKRLGLPWDRAQVAAATNARVIDNRTRRETLKTGLLDDIDRIRPLLFAPYVFVGGSAEGPKTISLDSPDAAALRNYVSAIGLLIGRHVDLDKHDTDNGVTEAKSMLSKMAERLGVHGPESEPPP